MTKANDIRVDFFSSNVSFLCLVFLFLKLNSREIHKKGEGREGNHVPSIGHCLVTFPFLLYLALWFDAMRKLAQRPHFSRVMVPAAHEMLVEVPSHWLP